MRIFDQNGNELQREDIDFSKGYLVDDTLFVEHHEAIEAVAEEGHWETVAEYENGGKDVAWIIDVPGVEAQEAWDEYEKIQRYILYTEEELEAIAEAERARKMPPAPRNITAGEYITINDVLYLATENIPSGEPVIAGQNAIITTIEAVLYELKGE